MTTNNKCGRCNGVGHIDYAEPRPQDSEDVCYRCEGKGIDPLWADIEMALDLLFTDHVYPTALTDGRYVRLSGTWATRLGRLAAKHGRFVVEREDGSELYGRFKEQK